MEQQECHELISATCVVDNKGYSLTEILEQVMKEIEYIKEPYKRYWDEKVKHKSV